MKKLIFILCLLLFPFNHLFSQWFQTSSFTQTPLSNVKFFDANSGIMLGYLASGSGFSYIYRTNNGGTNWSSVSYDSCHFASMYFTDASNGWISGRRVSNSIYKGVVLKTVNNGANWTLSIPDSTVNLLGNIFFINSNTGWIGLDLGQIMKTINGGANWTKYQAAPTGNPSLYRVFFINENTGWCGGGASGSGAIYKTVNGGINWTGPYSTLSFVNSIYFMDANTGFIATGGSSVGSIQKSTDGGVNWVTVHSSSSGYVYYVFYLNSLTGFASGGPDIIMKTVNGGNNWVSQSLPTSNNYLNSIYFVNSSTGYSAGYNNMQNGFVFKTTNGGVSFINQIGNTIPERFSLEQNYPNPFNPSTNIIFQIQRNSFATLKIYDVTGKEVATLVNESLAPGKYEVSFDGSNLNSGVFFYRLTAGDYSETKRMLIIK